MDVTPIHPAKVDIGARDARIRAARRLAQANIDASALIGMVIGGQDADGVSHMGTVVAVDNANASSTFVRVTLDDGNVIHTPKSVIPGAAAQIGD